MMSTELKPCPFCGGTDIKIDRHIESRSPTGELFTMCCYDCGATFPGRYRRELLVKAWNKRVDTSKPTQSWIPVSERRPCDNQPVDVYVVVVGGNNNGDKSRVSNCFYDEDVNRFWYWNQRCTRKVYFSGFDVTHWMPLPSAPEQNK